MCATSLSRLTGQPVYRLGLVALVVLLGNNNLWPLHQILCLVPEHVFKFTAHHKCILHSLDRFFVGRFASSIHHGNIINHLNKSFGIVRLQQLIMRHTSEQTAPFLTSRSKSSPPYMSIQASNWAGRFTLVNPQKERSVFKKQREHAFRRSFSLTSRPNLRGASTCIFQRAGFITSSSHKVSEMA